MTKQAKKPEAMHNAKLDVSQVEQIKAMLERGVKGNLIAKMFKVSEMQITRIKRGENWGHVNARKLN